MRICHLKNGGTPLRSAAIRCLAAAAALLATATAYGTEAHAVWQPQQYYPAPATTPATEVKEAGVRALYLEGPAYLDKPSTKVFAFVGLPKNASAAQPVPGVVLLHGGGGTAVARWVRAWNEQGYAAIAIDHFGQLPIREGNRWQRNPQGGPDIDGTYNVNAPLQNQWMFHAVANAMLANSLLGSLPEVDSARIGLVGISWGAVVASNVSATDTRLRFVVPVYGCGFISESTDTDGSWRVGKDSPVELVNRWRALWDPAARLHNSQMPMLWVTGTTDFAFTLSSLERSVRAAQGAQYLCIRIDMEHSQQAGEAPPEIVAFADSIVKNAPALPTVTGSGIAGERTAWVSFNAQVPVREITLNYTRYDGQWQNRRWASRTLPMDAASQGRIEAELPRGTTAFFFNLIDERGLISSSQPVLNLSTPKSSQ